MTVRNASAWEDLERTTKQIQRILVLLNTGISLEMTKIRDRPYVWTEDLMEPIKWTYPRPWVPPNPSNRRVKKIPFRISVKRLEVNENVNRAHLKKKKHWLAANWCNEQSYTTFAKAPNDWTQIKHNMCGRRVAWSPLWWWSCQAVAPHLIWLSLFWPSGGN